VNFARRSPPVAALTKNSVVAAGFVAAARGSFAVCRHRYLATNLARADEEARWRGLATVTPIQRRTATKAPRPRFV
jgi:hypothetical protein